MKRVVILGRGGSGKSTLAERLGEITGIPVIELDKYFWQPDLTPTPPDQWAVIQQELVQHERWIMDGDLGPYDVVSVRLQAADTVIVLDFSFIRCAWRAVRRSRERADFWRWVLAYRRRDLPFIIDAIDAHAPRAKVHVLRRPDAVKRFLTRLPGDGTRCGLFRWPVFGSHPVVNGVYRSAGGLISSSATPAGRQGDGHVVARSGGVRRRWWREL